MNCSKCGRPLCHQCANQFTPPICANCASTVADEMKTELKKKIGVSVILMIIGVAITQNPMGFVLAGVPFGWSILTGITPSMFVWMPLMGWVIYFIVKFLIAYIIGIFVLPYKIYKYVTEIKQAESISQIAKETLG